MTSRDDPPSEHCIAGLTELPNLPPSFAELPAPVVLSEEELARMRSLIPIEQEERAKADSFRRAAAEHEAGVHKLVSDLLDTSQRDAEFMRGLRRSGWPFSDDDDELMRKLSLGPAEAEPERMRALGGDFERMKREFFRRLST